MHRWNDFLKKRKLFFQIHMATTKLPSKLFLGLHLLNGQSWKDGRHALRVAAPRPHGQCSWSSWSSRHVRPWVHLRLRWTGLRTWAKVSVIVDNWVRYFSTLRENNLFCSMGSLTSEMSACTHICFCVLSATDLSFFHDKDVLHVQNACMKLWDETLINFHLKKDNVM